MIYIGKDEFIGILLEIRFIIDRENSWKIFMKELSIWIKMVLNQCFPNA